MHVILHVGLSLSGVLFTEECKPSVWIMLHVMSRRWQSLPLCDAESEMIGRIATLLHTTSGSRSDFWYLACIG